MATVNADLDRTSDRRSILLVHGVGHHRPGAIQAIVAKALAASGWQSLVASEIDWDGLYRPERRAGRVLDVADLTAIGHAFWTSSWLGIERSGNAPWQRHLVRATSRLLTAAVATWLLLAVWWLLSLGAGSVAPSVPPLRVGLPWTSYVFPPVSIELLAPSAALARTALIICSRVLMWLSLALALTAWAVARTPLASAVRMAVFQVLWFPTYLIGILPTMLMYLAAVTFGVGFVSTFFESKFTVQLPDGTSWNVGPGWRELLTAAGAATVLAAIGTAAAWLFWRALKPIIDVVRYVGDQQLRTHVHRQLVSKAGELAAGSSVIIAAHSLGTVIAVDSLLSYPEVWSKFQRIDLLTAGSPLHRLLARFFRDAYPSVHDLAGVLTRSYPGCRWANVYRPTDYVGGRLPTALIANRRLWSSAWRSHSNYWGDRDAIASLAMHLTSRPRACVVAGEHVQPADGLDARSRLRPPDVARRPLGWLVTPIAVVGVIGIVWGQFGWTPRVEQANLAEWRRRVADAGASTVVEAVAAKAIDTATDVAQAKDYNVVAFAYRVGDRVYGAESNLEALFYATSRFPHIDWRKLKGEIEASARHAVPVTVVYSAADPRIFTVPAYETSPSYYGVGRFALYTMRALLAGGCWLVWCAFMKTLLEGLVP